MNKQKDLAYFMRLNYNAILKRINDYYYLFIPELSIIVEGKSLNEAYEKLEKEKEIYFKKAVELNAQDTVREPMPIIVRKKLFTDLLTFFTKISIIIIICTVIFTGSLPYLRRLAQKVRPLIYEVRVSVEDKQPEQKKTPP